VLKVSGVPASWRGEEAAAAAADDDPRLNAHTGGGGDAGGGDGRLVFRYRDKVLDDIDLRQVDKVIEARTKKPPGSA
jgi:hypothetical protein